jgi:hypothetical protein
MQPLSVSHPLQSVGAYSSAAGPTYSLGENMLITVALVWVYRSTIDSDMERHLIRVSSAAHSPASSRPAVMATKWALIRRPGSRLAVAGPAGPPMVLDFRSPSLSLSAGIESQAATRSRTVPTIQVYRSTCRHVPRPRCHPSHDSSPGPVRRLGQFK